MPDDTSTANLGRLTEASEFILAATPRWARASMYLMALVVLAALGWGYLGTVDLVVRAPGMVRPEGRIIRVQSEVQGRVLALHAREGRSVRAGECLVRLDPAALEVDQKKLRTLREVRAAKLAQLRADREKRAAEGAAETAKLQVAQQEAEAALAHTERTAQARQEARRAAIEACVATRIAATKEWEANKELREAGAVSEQELIKVDSMRRRAAAEEARARALAKVGTDDVVVAQRIVELRKKEREIHALQLKRELAALDADTHEAENAVADVDRDLEAIVHKLAKLAILAPVAATVTSLDVRAPGEVVAPGRTLMELAPEGARLVVEARVADRDVGRVRPGMPVRTKCHAFPYRDYGCVEGAVLRVAPDATNDPDRGSVYVVTVSLDQLTMADGSGRTGRVTLGMACDVEIVKERVRILTLLVRRFRKQLDEPGEAPSAAR